MKHLILLILLFFSFEVKSQSVASDVVFVYNDNSCLVTLTHEIVGIYVGGRIITSWSNPYTYDTPFAQVTRIGADIKIFKDVSVLVGNKMPWGFYQIEISPEVFVKMRLVNTIKQTRNKFDLTLMTGYSDGLMIGMGICLPMN